MNLHLDKLKRSALFFIGVNIILSMFALYGIFEGKDLLPIIIGVISVIAFSIILFVNRKKNLKQIWLFLVIISGLGLYVSHFEIFLKQRSNASRENSIEVLENNPAPTITYEESLNFAKPLIFEHIYGNNRFTIINFWATWCAPCLKEMPILEEFYKENKANGIGIIGFTDYKSGEANELTKIKALVRKLNITYPILIDTSTHVRVRYKADILPATVLIDETGKVLDYQIGIDGAKKIMQFVAEN